MNKRYLALTSAALALAALTSSVRAADTPLSEQDQQFVQAASQSSSTEIDASKLALKQSSDAGVKSFAKHMIAGHTKLTMQLKMKAPHGVSVPKDNTDPAVMDALKGLNGKQFDSAYIQKVGVEGHKTALAAFEKEAQDGSNADLKKAAQKALPDIKSHLRMAERLAKAKGITAAQ